MMNALVGDSSDAEIIGEVLAGNVNAFEALLERYECYVSGIATRHVPRESVREVAHDTFLRAYQSLKTFKGEKPFKHWLSKIAVRCCYDFWRAHYRNRERPISAISDEGRDWVAGVLSEASMESFTEHSSRSEAITLLHWALDRLSAEDRTVLTLTWLEGYSVREAAERLGWSVPNVKVRSFRARKKLRKVLSAASEGG
jgi:RNA polymerase sigma-70 factor (ECF subfamily)